MANIYEHKQDRLGHLLRNASSEQGARILIPDLQRPFVWQPHQVTLLVDSLIRGWPFGTLLTWDVSDSGGAVMPWRPFWRLVDKTRDNDTNSEKVAEASEPAPFQMVLDGQQRIQSLLLALGGDRWGFRLDDRDWKESLEGQRPRGRRLVHPHWTQASLFFDVDSFFRSYQVSGHVINIDYRKVLRWCAPAPDSFSTFPVPENYERPVPLRSDLEVNGRRLIRLSRIWHATPENLNHSEARLREVVSALLLQEGFLKESFDEKMQALGELMVALRSAKLSEVAYLQVKAFDDQIWASVQYNQAVVNIFTRLNTAGRTLTREEITFAWIKSGWERDRAGGQRADYCFNRLLERIKSSDAMNLELDQLVRVVSNLWALRYNQGIPLDSSDLLEGEKVAPMAGDISREWSNIIGAFESCLAQLSEQDLQFGQNRWFNSLNPFSFLVAIHLRWHLAYQEIESEVERHEAETQFLESIKHFAGRWLFNSTWSGLWSSISAEESTRLFQSLHEHLFRNPTKDFFRSFDEARDWMMDLVTDDAAEVVSNYEVSSRRMVSKYYPLLWLWVRLDEARWERAGLPLRVNSRKQISLEVDHIVASSFWESAIQTAVTSEDIPLEEVDGLQAQINQIGNCMLLEKNFNISKSNRPLVDWLGEVNAVQEEGPPDTWLAPFQITQELASPMNHSLEQLRRAFETRSLSIRAELVEYVRGTKERVDLA